MSAPANLLKPFNLHSIPEVSKWMRIANLMVTIAVIYLLWYLNSISFMFGIMAFSGTYLPVIYVLCLTIGLISLCATLAGNGFKEYKLSVVSPLITTVMALLLVNTQIYLYAIGIGVLGFKTAMELINVFHVWIIVIIILFFVSAFLSLMIAVQIKTRNEWFKKNPCIWPNDTPLIGNKQLSPMSPHPTNPGTGDSQAVGPPQNPIVFQTPMSLQKSFATQ